MAQSDPLTSTLFKLVVFSSAVPKTERNVLRSRRKIRSFLLKIKAISILGNGNASASAGEKCWGCQVILEWDGPLLSTV